MDDIDTVESTINKIRLHEQDTEMKLKEKHTTEATLALLKRKLNETRFRANKMKEEVGDITTRSDAIDIVLNKEKVRQQVLADQLEASERELQKLKIQSEFEIAKVWALRSSFCGEVQKMSDKCDVWALFTKPKQNVNSVTSKSRPGEIEGNNQVGQYQELLDKAQRRRQNLLAERDRLLNEPDSGEEFIRIKNALRYSVELAAQSQRVVNED